MITIKEYAAKKGVTERAVYKQMQSKKNARRIEEHVQIIEGKKWLDDVAVAILDESRQNAVVIMQENKDERIEELEQQLDELKEKALLREAELQGEIAKLNKESKELYKEKFENATLLAEASQNKLLLEEHQNRLRETEDKLHLESQRADREKERADQLQAEINQKRNKGFFQRLFRR